MTATRYRVVHLTTYRYSVPMVDGYTVAHVVPRPTPDQRVERAGFSVDPDPDELDQRTDLFGNLVVQVGVHRSHRELVVRSDVEVTVSPRAVPTEAPPWEEVGRAIRELRGDDAVEITPFVPASPLVDHHAVAARVQELTTDAFAPGAPLVEVVRSLCHTIFEQFEFDPTFSDVSTPLDAVLEHRRGVCQDFAHLAVACLRARGLAARYVSGYIETDPPPGQPRVVGADASHAWCSTWIPGWGWLDFDPTNDHLQPHRHVTVGWGRDYADITPVRGVVIGPPSDQELEVSVDMARVE